MADRNNIIRMAREAGILHATDTEVAGLQIAGYTLFAEAVKADAVAEEREACARHLQACNTAITDKLAAEIRARGQHG